MRRLEAPDPSITPHLLTTCLRNAGGVSHAMESFLATGNAPLGLMQNTGLVVMAEKGQFPGLFLFVGPARLMRPVRNFALGKIEYIDSLEQVYMNITIDLKKFYPGFTTNMELSKTEFLTNLANLIPMPDYNQSPRNMYQCQMGKQTMGTSCFNWPKQASNKLYRLQSSTTPLFRPVHPDDIGLEDFAIETNAIVAVISYRGYDMEDAMIINKCAHERGFAYGSIYKSKFIELDGNSYFARSVFFPHGFPSRRTIAMMIETMAGKSVALHGFVLDIAPFRFLEKHTSIDYFGGLLEGGCRSYYGTERLYSDMDGREMTDIFFSVLHYQQLRHMFFDKWQVRSTGPADATTQQPIKDRKRYGGVRFGEMERCNLDHRYLPYRQTPFCVIITYY